MSEPTAQHTGEHGAPPSPTEMLGIDPAVAGQQLNDKVGITLTEWSADRVVATMPVEGNVQPYGLLHGGANAVLAEALGSVCAAVNAGEGRATVGLDLHCTHHRGVRSGYVTGVATPVHVGRSTLTIDIVITDDRQRRTCSARLTCVAMDNAP